MLSKRGPKTKRLLDLIAVAEAPHRGYNAVQVRARIAPPAPPTKLTLGQIKAWVKATPRQQHAIGRYQFIPATFNVVQRRLGLSDKTRFSPAVQDRMAMVLVADAGYQEFLQGAITADRFWIVSPPSGPVYRSNPAARNTMDTPGTRPPSAARFLPRTCSVFLERQSARNEDHPDVQRHTRTAPHPAPAQAL